MRKPEVSRKLADAADELEKYNESDEEWLVSKKINAVCINRIRGQISVYLVQPDGEYKWKASFTPTNSTVYSENKMVKIKYKRSKEINTDDSYDDPVLALCGLLDLLKEEAGVLGEEAEKFNQQTDEVFVE